MRIICCIFLLIAGSVNAQLCLSTHDGSYVVNCYQGRLEEKRSDDPWDLSGVHAELVSTLNYDKSGAGAWTDFFPGSTHYMHAQGDALCTYLNLSDKALQYQGFSVASGKCVYDDPWNLYSLPLHVGDRGEDAFSFRSEIQTDDHLRITIGKGYYSYVVEEAGILTTPYGVFRNAFRINCKTTGTESSLSDSDENASPNSYTSEKTVWLSIQDGWLQEVASTYDGVDYFFSQIIVFKNEQSETVISEMTAFPDPATDRVYLSVPGDDLFDAVVSLFDSRGNLVMRKEVRKGSSPLPFDISKLKPGYYQVMVSSLNRELKTSFIKI